MKIEGNHVMASEGKVLRRKESGEVFGSEIWLGYSYYIGGKKLDEPHLDTAEDFEEIDTPDDFEEVEGKGEEEREA